MTVFASRSYWCFMGSMGFGSMRKTPLKPIERA